MLQKIRETLTLVLLALLPLHALLVTVGTKLIAGPGHAPMTALALWKEALLGVILVVAVIEFFAKRVTLSGVEEGHAANGHCSTRPNGRSSGRAPLTMTRLHLDPIDWLIVALIVLGVAVSVALHVPRGSLLLGFRYDFVPLVAFLVLRRVPWSEWFQRTIVRLLLIVGGIIAALGIVSFFLPVSFFVKLGYANLHSLYVPDQPLAPFQQIGESWVRRIQGTMSGPNQMGVWLLLPLSIFLVSLVSGKGCRGSRRCRGIRGVLGLLLFFALLLTFSRAAWIAAFMIIVLTLWKALPRRMFRRLAVWAGAMVLVVGIVATVIAPQVFFRLSSSRGHLVRPLQAVAMMAQHPFGLGLGSAGPASNRTSEPCVFLRPQDDPAWAKSQPALCVFLGTTQVQPADHACTCPFLPENWYLQIGVELGVLGFALFVALTVLVLMKLKVESGKLIVGPGTSHHFQLSTINYQLLLFFLSVSVAALFLHAWEDAAVAYSGWVLAGVAMSWSRRDGG